jgi:hypothetical protein
MPEVKKDRWDKAETLFKIAIVPLILVIAGFVANSWLQKRQEIEAKTHLYAELMSKREEADTSLRKEMFRYIIETFLTPRASGYEQQVLALELLAYNFHEALDLSPLFKHVREMLSNTRTSRAYVDRLEKSASDVASKQIAALEEAGGKLDGTIDFELLEKNPAGIKVIEGMLDMPSASPSDPQSSHKRHFTVEALTSDSHTKEVRLKLEVRTVREGGADADYLHSVFWVGFFDFPMIDNTRLPNGDRCAIVLRQFHSSSAQITLVYFPATRASLKDKPYYDEVLSTLLNVSQPKNRKKDQAQ